LVTNSGLSASEDSLSARVAQGEARCSGGDPSGMAGIAEPVSLADAVQSQGLVEMLESVVVYTILPSSSE